MGDTVPGRMCDARRLEHRELGEALPPEPPGRWRHRHDPREKADPPFTVFGLADYDIDLMSVDNVGAVLGAADRRERGRRDPRMRRLGPQCRHGYQIGHQRFEMIAL